MSTYQTPQSPEGKKLPWWQKTAIYEIWPRSFMDSNGDGIGDIPGIISRLDYIKDLGFETIWTTPFFGSPHEDSGYDISDYCAVAPEYGTMDDALRLIREVHSRGMHIIFDLVMNHTSHQHPWFVESRSSRDSRKRDWYIWREGKGKNQNTRSKNPPNNWMSMIGGRGWQFDTKTSQWFYTSFLPFQPDLNYRNPEVKKAMFEVVRFWLGKGVDGFRLDIFNCICKDPEFKNNPFSIRYLPSPHSNDEAFFQKKVYSMNHPDSFQLARELRSVIDEFTPERFVVGEVSGKDRDIRQYLSEENDGLNLIFLFESVNFRWQASFFRDLLRKHELLYPYPAMPTYVFSNHDIKRSISRLRGDMEKAKLLALFQMTARGVPVVYYGDEIGMTHGNLPFKNASDPLARKYDWLAKPVANALGLHLNRDDSKVPMQWSARPNAGFCPPSAKPWLPANRDYIHKNVETQIPDPNSLFAAYRNLLRIRNSQAALREGTLQVIDEFNHAKLPGQILAYSRKIKDEEIRIIINFGGGNTKVPGGMFQGTILYQSGPKAISPGGDHAHSSSRVGASSIQDHSEYIISGHAGLIIRE